MADAEALALLRKEIASLVDRLRRWTPQRWAVEAAPWGSRADLARHLAQALADAAAVAEGGPPRRLPRLEHDLLVPDQLAVTGDDLVRAEPSGERCRDVVAHLLLHRFDLLGDDVPVSLGGAAQLERGRTVCER